MMFRTTTNSDLCDFLRSFPHELSHRKWPPIKMILNFSYTLQYKFKYSYVYYRNINIIYITIYLYNFIYP